MTTVWLYLDCRPGQRRRFPTIDAAWAYVLGRYPRAFVGGLADEDYALIFVDCAPCGSYVLGEIVIARQTVP